MIAAKVLRRGAIGVVVAAVTIQLVPYGRAHSNPPVRREPSYDSADTRRIVVAACFDCHSNQTRWPWYTSIAPASWYVTSHVDSGRRALNFSDWARAHGEGDASEAVRSGSMPPASYTLLHPSAKLSVAERDQLARWLRSVSGRSGSG